MGDRRRGDPPVATDERTHAAARRWVAALVVASAYVLAGWTLGGVTGLVRTIVTNTPDRRVLSTALVPAVDLDGVDPAGGGPTGVTVTWRGVWEVPASGLYDLALDAQGRSSWTIDDSLANAATTGARTQTVWLDAGFHRIELAYDVDAPAPRIAVLAAPTGRTLVPLEHAAVKPRPPRNPQLRAATRALHRVLGWLAIVVLVWAIRGSAPVWKTRWDALPRPRAWMGRASAGVALACILTHGALLRIDGITGRYGTVTSPAWLAAVQTRSIAPPEAIRHEWLSWEREPLYPHRDGRATHYRSDPYVYLESARTMTSFYGAHFREPLFPFATKVSLGLLGGQDVAVSFTSVFFSTLAILFTYLLGAAVWSRPIGLVAAAGLSLETDVISLAGLGWRDDAYMAAVTLCAWLMVRWWKAGATRYLPAVLVGVAGGFAILTRIMAVPLLVAGLAYLLLAWRDPWRRRLVAAGLAIGAAAIVAGPYFVNCWRVYGDPFYTFNVHGGVYGLAEGRPEWTGSTTAYITGKIAQHPFEMLDTVAQGLTTYPFLNKWYGFDGWFGALGAWIPAAALAGLAVLAASVQGRLLLVVLVSSLAPFAFTWTVDPNFRFTVHAYPIYLIAAAVALGAGARAARALLVPNRGRSEAWWRTPWRPWAATIGAALVVVWFVARVSPSWVFAEALGAGEDATLTAGTRDAASFTEGWSGLIRSGNVSLRVAREEGALSIRLPAVGDYPATLRMDPFPRPLDARPRLPTVEVVLNGVPVTTIPLEWTPDRVGAYDIVLPRAAVRRGANRLVLRVGTGDAIGVWYVRVRPRIVGPFGL